jgi:hypothetical protein
MTRTPLAAALAIALAGPVSAQWIAEGSLAIANPGQPVQVGITFDEGETCDRASLFIIGNQDVRAIGLIVDGTSYGSAEAANFSDVAMTVMAGPNALRALKHGTSAAVITDQGMLNISLRGSSAAMNAAYSGCLRNVEKAVADYIKPLKPSARPIEPAGSVTF